VRLPAPQSQLAHDTLKDPYLFDFLGLGNKARERAIETGLVRHVTRFLLELGSGFAFVGRQYRLEVEGDEFFIDLLFYHTRLKCYVVVELKATEFKPEHAGQLNFYLTAVDRQVKSPDDKPTIGLLLCKTRSHSFHAEGEFPTLEDFEREFPSLCFALATGVGKTRLMGAFIAYLHLAHGINNFFVLAPNLTIYNKLIADFTRNTPKYVFKGIAEFAQQPPLIITGDNYDQTGAAVDDQSMGFAHDVRINIFNISKINSEVRGGKEPRIKRMREVLGDSYFNHLANLPDLVLLMDESHRYRASAGVRAINELKPLFGLEVTATPFVESGKGPVPFKNVVMDYPLARAMEDGFVKEPAVVTQRNFNAKAHTPEEVEKIKLEDGVRLHETPRSSCSPTPARTASRW
jgi:hypothetical protein